MVLAGAALVASACSGPKAQPIRGDIASVLKRGITFGHGSFDHTLWDDLVSRYAVNGGRRFDYAGLRKDEKKLKTYLDALARADLEALSSQELEALFANAYNAFTVATILEHVSEAGAYGIQSIRDIDNVFGREAFTIGGFRLSLDGIEHNILRPVFRDPRMHFAINCASISCPPIPTRALTGAGLDEELEKAARNVLGNPDYVSVENDALLLSKILDWYGADFVNPEYSGSEKSLPAFVSRYANEDVRRFLEKRKNEVAVRFRDYDWRLNK